MFEKAKRHYEDNADIPAKPKNGASYLWIIFVVFAFVLPVLGNEYQLAARFTLPAAIFLLWIGAAMALWQYRQAQA